MKNKKAILSAKKEEYRLFQLKLCSFFSRWFLIFSCNQRL